MARSIGYERLERTLRDNACLKPRALLAVLLHELRLWSGADQADDITMVIFRRRLEQLDVELRGIADDVLGPSRSAQLWVEVALPGSDGPGGGLGRGAADDRASDPRAVWARPGTRIEWTASVGAGRVSIGAKNKNR